MYTILLLHCVAMILNKIQCKKSKVFTYQKVIALLALCKWSSYSYDDEEMSLKINM